MSTISIDALADVNTSTSPPSTQNVLIWGGTNWVPGAATYDVGFACEGKANASEVIGRFLSVRSWTIKATAPLSLAKAGVAATGSTTFDLQKNGASFGSLVFAASGTSGTFTVASDVSWAVGDVLTVVAPASADATLANIAITLAGLRS